MKQRNLIAGVLIAGLSPAVLANETYRFDPSGSTIGFSVRQFLGTTDGKFTKFNGKIDVDRERPENSSVAAQIDVRTVGYDRVNNLAIAALLAAFATGKAIVDESSARAAVTEVTTE